MTTTTAPLAPLLPTREVAAILGVSIDRVHHLVRDGELRSVRLGGEGWHRFAPSEVERFIRKAGERDAP